jgi:uncharacterized protein
MQTSWSGVGARTVRSLAMVAEVVHGAPCRFQDPARFSLAHGGKDRHPYARAAMQSAIAAAAMSRCLDSSNQRRLRQCSRHNVGIANALAGTAWP